MAQRTIRAPAVKGSVSVRSVVEVVSTLQEDATSVAAPRMAKKRAPSSAFMKAMTPSAALAAIIGDKPLPRTEVTKKVWDYIKKNGLQDKVKRQMIHTDSRLKTVFGKSKLSMFEMEKKIGSNLK